MKGGRSDVRLGRNSGLSVKNLTPVPLSPRALADGGTTDVSVRPGPVFIAYMPPGLGKPSSVLCKLLLQSLMILSLKKKKSTIKRKKTLVFCAQKNIPGA